MKKLPVFIALFCMFLGPRHAFAFNPIQDVLDQTTFPIGQVASVGTSLNLKNGDSSTSLLMEVADYRMLALSYGGTRVNQNDANFTDTLKLGFKLNWLLSKFTNPLPPTASLLKQVNIRPSIACNLITGPRQLNYFMDINLAFGGGTPAVTPAP